MKILHTADLHIGKRLFGKSRLDEQKEVLCEIADIADKENVDVIIAAGDIFDTSVPTSEAEELFYETAVKFANNGRVFVALAGNHDDAARLAAPSNIAKVLDILLIGDLDNSRHTKKDYIVGGEGYIKIYKNGEILNLAVLPYPRLSSFNFDDIKELSYEKVVGNTLKSICEKCFDGKGYNVIASHLYVKSGADGDKVATDKGDEVELGTAALLSKGIIPDADYTALGHIHKKVTVSKSRNIFYSGSILSYSFDDTEEKAVSIAEFSTDSNGKKKTDVKRVPLKCGKKLLRYDAETFDDALKFLNDNLNAHIEVIYKGAQPLYASEIKTLKGIESFVKIEIAQKKQAARREFKEKSPTELFKEFYKFTQKTESDPSAELTEMFLSVLNNDEV